MSEPDKLTDEAKQTVEKFLSSKKWMHPRVAEPTPESQTRYQVRLAKARDRNAKNHKIRKAKKDALRKAEEAARLANLPTSE